MSGLEARRKALLALHWTNKDAPSEAQADRPPRSRLAAAKAGTSLLLLGTSHCLDGEIAGGLDGCAKDQHSSVWLVGNSRRQQELSELGKAPLSH